MTQERETDAAPRADHERIALAAYERFQMRGAIQGLDQEDWYEAERQLQGRSIE